MTVASTTGVGLAYPIAVILAQAPAVPEQPNLAQEIRIVSTGISADVFGTIRIGDSGIQFLRSESFQDTAVETSTDQLDDAEARAQDLPHDRMRNEALAVISDLRQGIPDLEENLPVISTSQPDDGSFIIEFITRDKRAGFTIEPEEGQSGWFFASLDGSKPISASGNLGFLEPIDLLKKLVSVPSHDTA